MSTVEGNLISFTGERTLARLVLVFPIDKNSHSQEHLQAVLANVQLEGGAGPPSLLGEEPEAEELLQAYETQKKVNIFIFQGFSLMNAKDIANQKLLLIGPGCFIRYWHW